MKNPLVVFAASVLLAMPITAKAQSPVLKPIKVLQMEGQYAGTFFCESGEMGMSLHLKDIGPVINPENKSVNAKKRQVNGIINFFPIAGNPGAPRGAFKVGGTADMYNGFARIDLKPGKWIDKPEKFGASGLKGTIFETGNLVGRPTFPGCYRLDMTKLRTQ